MGKRAIVNEWDMSTADFTFSNNIVFYKTNNSSGDESSSVSGGWGSSTFTHNFWYGLDQGAPSVDLNPIGGSGTTDPLFIHPENLDFRLQNLSIGINVGSANVPSIMTNDFYFNARPQDGGIDVGAYEASPEPSP